MTWHDWHEKMNFFIDVVDVNEGGQFYYYDKSGYVTYI